MENLKVERHPQNEHTAYGIIAGALLGSIVIMGTVLMLYMRWGASAHYGIGRESLKLHGQTVESVSDAIARVRGTTQRATT